MASFLLIDGTSYLIQEDGGKILLEPSGAPEQIAPPGGVPRRSVVLERMEEDAVIAALLSQR